MDARQIETTQRIKDYYETIIMCMPGNVYWFDTSLKAQGCNQNVLDMFGLEDINQFIGLDFEDMAEMCGWSTEARQQFREDSEHVLTTKKPITNREDPPIKHANGKLIYFLTDRVPILDRDNHLLGIIGISVDITERKELVKKLEHANKAKAEFIANMSHDIRTPLTGIIGLSSVVEMQSQENEIKQYARMLNISGEQLLSLLNSVLDIVASDTVGHKSLRVSVFNLEDLLRSIFELERPSLQIKSIDFKLEMDKALPQFIESDKEKLYRIILNILSNAIKFTHNGSITVVASLVAQQNDTILTKIQIIDTGIGIPKEEVSKVFEQFYRANTANEGKFDGYGVGLHIVQKYLQLLKGEVLIESEVNKGTCISLTLPFKKASSPNNYSQLASALSHDNIKKIEYENKNKHPSEDDKPTAKVLLVEDNPIARTVTKTMLMQENVQVLEAENSTDAYALFVSNSFDFVVTDISLPDYSGLELAKKMSQFEATTHCTKTPIIALSGHNLTENISDYKLKYGLTGVFMKPLNKHGLTQLLELVVNAQTSEIREKQPQDTQYSPNKLFDEALAIDQLGSIEMCREMIQMMLDDAFTTTICDINKHFESQNWIQLKAQVHKFKSSCTYCATTALLECAKQLEARAESQDLSKIAPVYERFLSCADKTKYCLVTWLA